MSDGSVVLRAENQSNGSILVRIGPMLAGIVQIKVHLPGVGVSEFPKLQLYNYESLEPPMKEKQIDAIPFRSDPKALLSGYESKVISQLHEELFQFADKRLFEFGFGVFVFEPKEFEHERIFDLGLGRSCVGRLIGRDC